MNWLIGWCGREDNSNKTTYTQIQPTNHIIIHQASNLINRDPRTLFASTYSEFSKLREAEGTGEKLEVEVQI
jgi:hypothetical protein